MFLRTLLCLFVFVNIATAAEPLSLLDPASAPGARQPQLAISPKGRVYVVFGAREGLFSVASTDGVKSFSSPVKVGDPTVFALGMRRGPRVAATDKAVVVTVIGGEQGGGRDGDVLAYRSSDEGRSWSGPVKVNTVKASAREGLHHMAAAPDGTIHLVWLDLRNQQMELWAARSPDGGATWKDERQLDTSGGGKVCTCCQPQIACDPRGGVHVMWRNDLAKARDMYLMSSRDGGETFGSAVKLGEGTWLLDRCPMDGGALAVNARGEIETIWMRKHEIFRARPGEGEVSLGRGEQGWIAASAEGFYRLWIQGRPGVLRVQRPGMAEPTTLAQGAWDPVVAATVSGKGPVVAVWEEGPNKGPMRLRAAVLNEQR